MCNVFINGCQGSRQELFGVGLYTTDSFFGKTWRFHAELACGVPASADVRLRCGAPAVRVYGGLNVT